MTMSVVDYSELKGWEGIYEPSEAAKYLRASAHSDVLYPFNSTKLIRWIRRGLGNPELVDIPGRSLLIDFDDLISMRMIAALLNAGMSWRAIHKAEEWLREMTGSRQPFASEPLWAGRGEVFIEWGDKLISATLSGQIGLDLIREYLIPIHGLEFDPESHRPISWEPSTDVVLQPVLQFGAPCIKGTRIPTRAVSGMIAAGDSIEWVAQSYCLPIASVQAACDWELKIENK